MGFHTFPKAISLKVNAIGQLEFELTYFKVAIPDAIGTIPIMEERLIKYIHSEKKLLNSKLSFS